MAALLHDVGKPSTTTADLKAHGHADAGVPVAKAFLESIGAPVDVIEVVLPLVREHMVRDCAKLTPAAIRRLAVRLAPATIDMLAELIEADGGPNSKKDADDLVLAAHALNVASAAPKPLVMGRHLIELGMRPGPRMGALLRELFDDQISGAFTTVEEGIEIAKKRVAFA
jgi:tRNA nucleotidyltransferase (CCA-adding enzyme)